MEVCIRDGLQRPSDTRV